nr:MAG TPA: hypothetical protein [Caudoviricetes sp.]
MSYVPLNSFLAYPQNLDKLSYKIKDIIYKHENSAYNFDNNQNKGQFILLRSIAP